MSEFESRDFTGDAPDGVCPTCAAGGLHHLPTGVDILHCSHAYRGAYRVRKGAWKIIPGVEHSIFRETMARGLLAGEVLTEMRHDVAQILEQESQQATKH